MKYISTRGKAPSLGFEEVVLAGLASDGGLYVPETIPTFSPEEIASFKDLSYRELAVKIMQPYVADALSEDELTKLVNESYDSFRHEAIAPLKQLNTNEWVLELFHGPTLAFKDFALQFLGRLVDHFLTRRDKHVVVLGATSGDTGSAALAGCRGRDRMQSFILFPNNRVSEVQRRQMTTMTDANIHNIALDGTFDDCQDIVKSLFADAKFRETHHLVAVNSINWARILAQVVYYFYAALRLGAPAVAPSFSVPTGNFGDIFAGYIAKQMGLPMGKLIIATNRNDILARCVLNGEYTMQGVTPTISPSMDIQISSNFERMLYLLYDRDADSIADMMQRFRTEKTLAIKPDALDRLRAIYDSLAVDDETTKQTIKDVYTQTGELLDPHTAIGVKAARACHKDDSQPVVSLATAHPAKFPDAVTSASNVHPELPDHLSDLFELKERFDVVPNDIEQVKQFIVNHKQ
ncbi:MAG: threonine synthase [Rickettsiales bacterium]|nr:threonine synthase [Rickettsiales bacterium]